MPICLPSFAGVAQPASGGTPFTNQYSVSFDGSDDFATFTPGIITATTSHTFSLWLNVNAFPTSGIGFALISPMLSCLTLNSDNDIIFETRTGSNYAFGSKEVITNASEDTWYHLVVVKQANTPVGSTTFTYYVDGSSVGTFVLGSVSNTYAFGNSSGSSQLIHLGKYSGGGYFTNILIDEMAIFTSALDSTAISSIYNGGVPGDLSSLNPRNWYRMGDGTEAGSGTTVYDMGASSGTTTDITLTNGPTFSTSVPEYVFNQYSVSFDGTDDYMSIGTVSELNGSISAVTLSAWFNFSGTYHTDKNLVLSGGASGSDRFYFQQLSATQLRYGSSSGFVNFTIPTVSASTWYHMAIVHNGTSASAYFNGSPSSSNPQTVTAPTANYGTALKVGAYYTGSAVFGGLLDEVSVFDSALSASNITSIYNSGVPNDISSLSPVGWWRMGDNDSGTGTTVTDQGSGGNDGTLTNGPTFSTTVPS